MLKRTTLLLLVGAVGLGGGILLLESRRGGLIRESAEETATDGADGQRESLFPFAEAEVDSFRVERAEGAIAFLQAGGTWQMTAPQTVSAEAGAVAFLLSQLTDQSARQLSVEAAKLEEFGLTEPTAQVDLVADGKPYQLLIGSQAFTGDQLYVQAIDAQDLEAQADDSPAAVESTVDIYLVPARLANAVNRPTAEWIAQAELSDPDSAQPDSEASPSEQ